MKVKSLVIVLILLIPASPLYVALTPITCSALSNFKMTEVTFPPTSCTYLLKNSS